MDLSEDSAKMQKTNIQELTDKFIALVDKHWRLKRKK